MSSKILIVEDQGPVEILEIAVNEVFQRNYDGFSSNDYSIAYCFNEAKDKIENGKYDFVLLDHRMPIENQRDLERKDFKAFCATLRNVGYGLIPLIKEKNKETVIIGTSSLSRDELKHFSSPDFYLEKVSMQVCEDLEKIIRQVKSGEERK